MVREISVLDQLIQALQQYRPAIDSTVANPSRPADIASSARRLRGVTGGSLGPVPPGVRLQSSPETISIAKLDDSGLTIRPWLGSDLEAIISLACDRSKTIFKERFKKYKPYILIHLGHWGRFLPDPTLEKALQKLSEAHDIVLSLQYLTERGFSKKIFVPILKADSPSDLLLIALGAADPKVRSMAAWILGKQDRLDEDPQQVRNGLAAALQREEDGSARESIAITLGQLGSRRAINSLIPLVSRGETSRREEILRALIHLATPKAVFAVVEAILPEIIADDFQVKDWSFRHEVLFDKHADQSVARFLREHPEIVREHRVKLQELVEKFNLKKTSVLLKK
jgi:hypothetical protein